MPIQKRLLARLPVRRVLQLTVVDAATRNENWPTYTEPVVDRQRSSLQQGHEARDRRARDGWAQQSSHRLQGESRVPLRLTLNSTWLLLRSATDVWPGGLGSSSGELGHNLMDHHFRVGASGDLDGLEDKYYCGRRPTGFYIPRDRNLSGEKRPYLRGFGYQGSASRDGWSR